MEGARGVEGNPTLLQSVHSLSFRHGPVFAACLHSVKLLAHFLYVLLLHMQACGFFLSRSSLISLPAHRCPPPLRKS